MGDLEVVCGFIGGFERTYNDPFVPSRLGELATSSDGKEHLERMRTKNRLLQHKETSNAGLLLLAVTVLSNLLIARLFY